MTAVRHDCAFCAIAAGAEETEVIASGEEWVAFFPLEPATVGHTLVVPRKHTPDFWTAEPGLDAMLAEAAHDVGLAIDRALKPDGMNLITSSGLAAEQTVYHLHLHVLPRWKDDGFDDIWSGAGVRDEHRLALAATAIRRELVAS